MFKRLKKLFKPRITIKLFNEGDKVIIYHNLRSINAFKITPAEVKALMLLQNERHDDLVEIRTKK